MLMLIYGSNPTDPAFHLPTDMGRLQTFAFVAKTEENIVIIVILYKRKPDKEVIITVRGKVFISTIIQNRVQDRFMDADFDRCLHSR